MWKIKEAKWKRLDNAAKIFPALAGREDSEVFRIACTIREEVDPVLLQQAVDAAVEEHPSFTETVRAGLFWYYLEDTGLRPKVHEETESPLQPLYDERYKLLIDISYYKKRINFEIFHAIADGTGAMIFFRTILANYLALAHPEALKDVPLERYDSTEREKAADGFTEYFEPKKGSSVNFEFLGSKSKKIKVYQFNEAHTPDCRQLVTEGEMSVAAIKKAAKAEGATITEFLCAHLIQSIHSAMRRQDYDKTISIAVPVNLRTYFSSNTMRNFFGMIEIRYSFGTDGPHTLGDIIRSVRESFRQELTRENMEQKIASQVKMERHPIVRVCPLILKDIIMVILQGVSMKRRTICLSNVGRIEVQPELAAYIEDFDLFNSSSKRQVCMCSFGDTMMISFAGVLAEHDVERAFFRSLAKYDENLTIATNYSAKEFE